MGRVETNDAMLDIFDPACVPDTFCEGIGCVQKIAGNCIRFTIFATRDLGGGQSERIVVARLVWAIEALRIANLQNRMVIDGMPFMSAVAPSVMAS